MLANWVQETTATTGTGTITLAGAVSGFTTFTSQFSDGETVYYSIEDGTSREIGIGTFTSSGTTLSRDTVLETLVSGTLDNTSPAALNLSGSAVVSVTGGANSLQEATPQNFMPTVNKFIPPMNSISTIGSAFTVTANRLIFSPSVWNVSFTAASIVMGVATAVASSNTRVGLYAAGGDGSPDKLIIDSGTLTGGAFDTSTTGAKSRTLSSNINIKAGRLYYLAILSDSGIGVLRGGGVLGVIGTNKLPVGSSLTMLGSVHATQTYGALPTTAPATTGSDTKGGFDFGLSQ